MSPIKPENRPLYPPDWWAVSQRIRFQRAGGRCECVGECGFHVGDRCQARHNEPHPDTGALVLLTTAHLDHDPANCADENLRAMCQRCHLTYDAHHHARNASATRDEKSGQLAIPGIRDAA